MQFSHSSIACRWICEIQSTYINEMCHFWGCTTTATRRGNWFLSMPLSINGLKIALIEQWIPIVRCRTANASSLTLREEKNKKAADPHFFSHRLSFARYVKERKNRKYAIIGSTWICRYQKRDSGRLFHFYCWLDVHAHHITSN